MPRPSIPFYSPRARRRIGSQPGSLGVRRVALEPLEERNLLAAMPAYIDENVGDGAVIRHLLTPASTLSSDQLEPAPPWQLGNDEFHIQLNKSARLLANPEASAAFDRAAEFFEGIFHDPVTVVIDADWAPLGPSILGQTGSERVEVPYYALRKLLINDAQDDEGIVNELPTQLNVTFPITDDIDTNPFFLGTTTVNRATAKALGLATGNLPGPNSIYVPNVRTDMTMSFSSDFEWDFDPSDGIDADKFDFFATAIHEIGHGLGFVSSVDIVDFMVAIPEIPRIVELSTLDLFRLAPGAGQLSFSGAARNQVPGFPAVFYDGGIYNPPQGFNIPNLKVGDIPMSTGQIFGDGNQASHWKADDITDIYIGVMDPTGAPGELDPFTAQDARAFGLIGWDLHHVDPPVVVSVTSSPTQAEGDSGTQAYVFTITAAGLLTTPFTVNYSTAGGTAFAGSDYQSTSGVLTFGTGLARVQTVTVLVNGDTTIEGDETFALQLSSAAVPGLLGTAQGTATIVNDDATVSIDDVSIVEGASGTKDLVFTVTSQGGTAGSISVQYTTVDQSAQAGADYLARAGTVTLPSGNSSAKVTVPIVGDGFNEGNETFWVLLTGAQGARLDKNIGVGTIIDDDGASSLYVNDVQVTANASGTVSAVFTVALNKASGQAVSVAYATQDAGAVGGVDYLSTAGVLQFPAGVTTQQIVVTVLAGADDSPNKKFYLNLSQSLNATLADGQGVGTVVYGSPSPGQRIVDNGDAAFSHSGGWTNVTNTSAYGLDIENHAAGNGSGSATWTFGTIPAGTYQVLTRWVPFQNYASNAPFTILDASTPLTTVQVNQRNAPTGDVSNGVIWQSLGTVTIHSNTLVVRLNDNANGTVVADAVRIVAGGVTLRPEIDVAGQAVSIGTGDVTPSLSDATDFGSVAAITGTTINTFTVANTGNAALHLNGSPMITISGLHAADFTVVQQPTLTVGANQQTTFQIQFHPSAIGLRTATVSIANDDANEGNFTFSIQGTGAGPTPNLLLIDDSMPGFSSLGNWSTSSNLQAYLGQAHNAAAGAGGDQAQWQFSGLNSGTYLVYATWAADAGNATNAPFTISNGAGNAYTAFLNQQQPPTLNVAGSQWGSLGAMNIATGQLLVSLSNNANGNVAADAVILVRQGAAPEATLLAHNAALPADVNGNGLVSPFDLLLVVNTLQVQSQAGTAEPQAATAEPQAAEATVTTMYVDVNGDGRVSPFDALLVINYLLGTSAAPAVAEPLVAVDESRSVIDLALSLLGDEEVAEASAGGSWLGVSDDASEPGTAVVAPLTMVEAEALTSVDEQSGEESEPEELSWTVGDDQQV